MDGVRTRNLVLAQPIFITLDYQNVAIGVDLVYPYYKVGLLRFI